MSSATSFESTPRPTRGPLVTLAAALTALGALAAFGHVPGTALAAAPQGPAFTAAGAAAGPAQTPVAGFDGVDRSVPSARAALHDLADETTEPAPTF